MINLELNEKQKELIKLEYISIFVFKYNQEKIEKVFQEISEKTNLLLYLKLLL
mgnify:CR=1 FL=1